MVWTALTVLAIAAAGGLTLAAAIVRQRPFPAPIGYLHGAIGLSGVVLLAVAVFSHHQIMPVNTALVLFALTLVGGLFMLLFRLQREPTPGFMVVLHGIMALVALAVLLVGLSR